MKKYVIVKCDDWEQLYIDGKVSVGGHSLRLIPDLQEAVPDATLSDFEEVWADEKWVEEEACGCFPDKLEDVKLKEK